MAFWKNDGRPRVLASWGNPKDDLGWAQRVEGSAYTYWAVFLICLGFAGLFQWISVRLMPLLQGSGPYPIDWGSVALVLPEFYSLDMAIAFTGLAYLYMCVCFYLFFVGLILLYTVSHDLWEIEHYSTFRKATTQPEANRIRSRVLRGIFRCTLCGLLIAMCMKVQSVYLTTNAENIVNWLFRDAVAILSGRGVSVDRASYTSPTHYTSLLIAMVAIVPFLNGIIRIGPGRRAIVPFWIMIACVALLGTAYLLIGVFVGFSLLLGVSVLLGSGLIDHIQKMTMAAMAIADMKAWAQRS